MFLALKAWWARLKARSQIEFQDWQDQQYDRLIAEAALTWNAYCHARPAYLSTSFAEQMYFFGISAVPVVEKQIAIFDPPATTEKIWEVIFAGIEMGGSQVTSRMWMQCLTSRRSWGSGGT